MWHVDITDNQACSGFVGLKWWHIYPLIKDEVAAENYQKDCEDQERYHDGGFALENKKKLKCGQYWYWVFLMEFKYF